MDCNWIVLGAGAIVLGAWLTEELGWGMRDVSMEEEEEGVWPSRGNMRRTWCVGERGRGGVGGGGGGEGGGEEEEGGGELRGKVSGKRVEMANSVTSE
jgi:hypothetical protein